jgi:site-specific DNA recombinase
MTDDLVTRAHWGDLSGQNWAGLVRLSFELDTQDTDRETDTDDGTRPRFVPQTGHDIKGRDEQIKDARKFVESRGGNYVHTYEEPDTSAWKRRRVKLPDGRLVYRVIRPVFEGALNDLKESRTPKGERLDGLIVSDIDRLTRDNRHLEDAIEVVENFRRPIIDITGTLDLLTDNGRTVARIIVATKNQQSADTARRVRRKHEAMQQAGIPTGGRRPFGWNEDKRTLRSSEASEIKNAVKRILAGAPVAAITADWNKRGILTSSGKTWTFDTLKIVLRSPRICGYRARYVSDFHPVTGAEHKRVAMVFDDEGKPVKGQFEAIVSLEEWEAVTEIIGTAPTPSEGANARTYLSVGTLRCGKCDRVIRGTRAGIDPKKPQGYFYYACPSRGSGKGCGGVKIPGPETDAALVKLVIAKYEEEQRDRTDAARSSAAAWGGEDELARVREDIEDLKQARKRRQVSAERYFSMLAEHEAEERSLLADRNKWLRVQYAAQAEPVDLRRGWKGLPLAAQRAYMEKALTAVIVLPAPYRGAPVTERLLPVPRTP